LADNAPLSQFVFVFLFI